MKHVVVLSIALAGSGVLANGPGQRALTFQDRVKAQRAIEEVYWRHRIWPTENRSAKPPLSTVMPDAAIRAKVEDYLRKSKALATWWQRPVTGEQLQAEMSRMAKSTREPEMLKELYAALGNDAHLIAETLARPTLVDRLIRNWYAHDERFHGVLKQKADEALAATSHDAVRMRKLGGEYRETEWRLVTVKSETTERNPRDPTYAVIELTAEEWREQVAGIAAAFGVRRRSGRTDGAVSSLDEVHLSRISSLREEDASFGVTAVLAVTADRVRTATVTWAKRPFDAWWAAEGRTAVEANGGIDRGSVRAPVGGYQLQSPHDGGCTPDTWTALWYSPAARSGHTAVWTGTEMIVWGGEGGENTGGRYDPATDSWTATSTGAGVPSERSYHAAVWTGTEMIVWGGHDSYVGFVDTGGRYDPATDTWTATSTGVGVPLGRQLYTVVWTGTEMIVWGGINSGTYLNSGGRYDPATDTWAATSTGAGVPSERRYHTAVWTGTEMIVWGGWGWGDWWVNTGARYDPATDMWTPTSTMGAPSARALHTAVWTGTAMIVWGGYVSGSGSTGARYDPATDTWTATSTGGGEPPERSSHRAVWTGTEMIVWGGWTLDQDGRIEFMNTGGRYTPTTDTWTATSTGAGVPAARDHSTAVWTGTEMIVWGGGSTPGSSDDTIRLDTGGRYDPATDTWTATSRGLGVQSARSGHTAVWTGAEMIVWGGYSGTGERYDPATDTWTATSTGVGVPSARSGHAAVWTGAEMIVWGGFNLSRLNSGGRYDPATDTWAATSTGVGVPSARSDHTAVWTGTEMIVWGGGAFSNTGERYDPVTDTWTPTSTIGAPSARALHTAVWTGTEMIVWGGEIFDQTGHRVYLNSGGRYNSATDTWAATSTGAGVPSARADHTAVWSGTELIVWGGCNGVGGDCFYTRLNTGGRYEPRSDRWTPTSTGSAVPSARLGHTAVWTGTEMVVWGADGNTGGRYVPATDMWTPTSTGVGVPSARSGHTAVWTGTEMIVWGGSWQSLLNSGGRYCACGAGSATTWYPDADDDGYGVASTGIPACAQPPGYAATGGDCNDDNAARHPGATELCNGIDDDCDGIIDNSGDALCDDSNVCTDDLCGGTTGCVHTNNTSECDDGNACTVGDSCSGGVCVSGVPWVCHALDSCHAAGLCDPATGFCSNPIRPNGTICDDNSLCTTGETCQSGICTPTHSGLDEPNPRTNGYYKRLCHGPHSGDQLTDADAVCVASVTATFAGISTVVQICEEIEPSHPNNDKCDQSDDDLMVLALNICRARVCTEQSIDSQCGGNTNVGQSLAASDAILDSPSRNSDTCSHAKCLDEEINTGGALEMNSLTLDLEGSDVRLDWTPPHFNEGTSLPKRYNVWRRVQGSLSLFTKIGETTSPSFLDTTSGSDAFEYEITAVMN